MTDAEVCHHNSKAVGTGVSVVGVRGMTALGMSFCRTPQAGCSSLESPEVFLGTDGLGADDTGSRVWGKALAQALCSRKGLSDTTCCLLLPGRLRMSMWTAFDHA